MYQLGEIINVGSTLIVNNAEDWENLSVGQLVTVTAIENNYININSVDKSTGEISVSTEHINDFDVVLYIKMLFSDGGSRYMQYCVGSFSFSELSPKLTIQDITEEIVEDFCYISLTPEELRVSFETISRESYLEENNEILFYCPQDVLVERNENDTITLSRDALVVLRKTIVSNDAELSSKYKIEEFLHISN